MQGMKEGCERHTLRLVLVEIRRQCFPPASLPREQHVAHLVAHLVSAHGGAGRHGVCCAREERGRVYRPRNQSWGPARTQLRLKMRGRLACLNQIKRGPQDGQYMSQPAVPRVKPLIYVPVVRTGS
jgi:hypothetical protein